MKKIKMEDCSVKTAYSGVYKITFPNGKIYIGISNNIYRRMLEHNTDFRNNLPIENAIKKYGKITEFEIVELIPTNNRALMQERERYWINYYKSNQKDIGYNVSKGGDGADAGSNNHEARFTEEEIQVIYDELANNLSISMEALANKYGISISTLSRINNGVTYYHSSIQYPLRDSKKAKKIVSGIKNSNAKLDQLILNKVYDALINELDIPMIQLAARFGISQTIIQNINSGKTYINNNFSYPLRKPKTGSRKLSNDIIKLIIFKIKNEPNKSLAAIGRELNINSKTISSINIGTIYKQKNEKYPIR